MGKRVRFQTVNTTTQGVDTSVTRPTEVAQSPEVIRTQASSMDKDGNVLDRTETVVTPQDPTLKFFGDVAAGGKNTLEGYAAIVDPEAYSEEGGEYYNRELRDKSVISGGIDTLTGKHTADEFFGEVGWRAQNEPGKLVGEVAVEAPLFFLNPLKVVRGAQAGSKVASSVLKAKLGASAIKAADGPTRAEAIHANKMAKFNKSVGDVNKLNKEIDVAATKVDDADLLVRHDARWHKEMSQRGNRTYVKTPNPKEPRSHVDAYVQHLADQKVSGKNPANWVEGSLYGVTDDVSKGVTPNLDSKLSKKFINTGNKKLRGYFGEKELFKQASEASHKSVPFIDTAPPKFDAELASGPLGDVSTLKQNKIWNKISQLSSKADPDLDMIAPRGQQFYKGDNLLTGAGIGAVGVG